MCMFCLLYLNFPLIFGHWPHTHTQSVLLISTFRFNINPVTLSRSMIWGWILVVVKVVYVLLNPGKSSLLFTGADHRSNVCCQANLLQGRLCSSYEINIATTCWPVISHQSGKQSPYVTWRILQTVRFELCLLLMSIYKMFTSLFVGFSCWLKDAFRQFITHFAYCCRSCSWKNKAKIVLRTSKQYINIMEYRIVFMWENCQLWNWYFY